MPSLLGNFFIKALVNSPFHSILGNSFAVITVTGRKTGKPITTPINVATVGGVLTVISLRDRTWWRNLREARPAWLRRAGKRSRVRAELLEAPEAVQSNLQEYFAQYPGYAKYYQIPSGKDGKPDPRELEKLSDRHVIIHLYPL
ncbi:MAG TPA: nitroreductase family deazaflavin-dependent oxidoreductase [Anaerolineales bacterium]|nr:nitroreductase family deazaflavin-dependent oxidoreductase [Anaerolineales bacterium]